MPYRLATPQYLRRHWEKAGDWDHLPIPCSCLGWVKGLEPSTPGTTIRCSNQLSYTHHIDLRQCKKMARLKGLEPLTHCLEGSCSIHLSYRRVWSG